MFFDKKTGSEPDQIGWILSKVHKFLKQFTYLPYRVTLNQLVPHCALLVLFNTQSNPFLVSWLIYRMLCGLVLLFVLSTRRVFASYQDDIHKRPDD